MFYTDAPLQLAYADMKTWTIAKDENGNDIMIYHARQYNEIIGDPLYDHNRHAYRMKIIWDIEGNPVFDYENNF